MKYLKTFEQISFKKMYLLYHGSPFKFDIFKDDITYFSETEEFAISYADAKAPLVESDDIFLYKCEIEANIFDINKEKDYDILKNELPDICHILDNRTWFDGDIKKETLLNLLLGKQLIEPDLDIIDKIKQPYDTFKYDADLCICLDKNETTIFYLYKDYYDKYLNLSINGKKGFDNFYNYINLETFKKFREEAIEYLKDKKLYNEDISLSNQIRYIDNNFKEKYLKPAIEELRINLIKDNVCKTFSMKPYYKEIKDNWNYYENDIIINIIKKHGYDGYVALEKSHNTYAIFYPKKCIKNIKLV